LNFSLTAGVPNVYLYFFLNTRWYLLVYYLPLEINRKGRKYAKTRNNRMSTVQNFKNTKILRTLDSKKITHFYVLANIFMKIAKIFVLHLPHICIRITSLNKTAKLRIIVHC